VGAGHARRVQVVAQARPARRAPCWRPAARPVRLPPTTMPSSASPSRTVRPPRRRSAGSRRRRWSRCRGRAPRGPAPQQRHQVRLELEAGVVGTDRDRVTGSILGRSGAS
jgi:hypothetical protein